MCWFEYYFSFRNKHVGCAVDRQTVRARLCELMGRVRAQNPRSRCRSSRTTRLVSDLGAQGRTGTQRVQRASGERTGLETRLEVGLTPE